MAKRRRSRPAQRKNRTPAGRGTRRNAGQKRKSAGPQPWSAGPQEWIGGRLTAPFFIEEGTETYQPELVLWVELPSGLIVGQQLVAPGEADGTVGQTLLDTIAAPVVGPPRRPDSIRVADAALAVEVRAAVGPAIPLSVAPTPELDDILEHMQEVGLGHDVEFSYLDEGRISPDAVADFFRAAEILYETAPWRVATDDQLVRLDIASLDVEGACLSIIGNLGESLGFLIFPSETAYDAFLEAEERFAESGDERPTDLGTDWLALSFGPAEEIPEPMRREVASHGWPIAGPNAYPVVMYYTREGVTRPPTARELEIATMGASSLCAFFAGNRSAFEADDFEPVCASYFDEEDREVRFTMPYEAHVLFDVNDAAPADRGATAPLSAPATGPTRARPRRNAPCPCGSGRKYKKCCLADDERAGAEERDREAAHELDNDLAFEIAEFAAAHLDPEWGGFARDFIHVPDVIQLALPWSIYHFQVDGRTAAEAFLERCPRRLSSAERAWIAGQQAAWLSLWEVSAVERGASVTLRDLLTDETRFVKEVSGSQHLSPREVLLARVVDREGVSLLCGSHPRPLPPAAGAEVLRRARGRLRRKRAVPIERLRDEAFGRYLIKRWEEAADDFDAAREDRQSALSDLQNTDGDPLLLTTDHFAIAPGWAADVEARIAALPSAGPPEAAEGDESGTTDAAERAGRAPRIYTFTRPGNAMHERWENTVVGQARLVGNALQLETNSQARADALRAQVEAACGERISHRAREHADPLSAKAEPASPATPAEPPPPEALQMLLDFKQRHYASWPDEPLPALGGKTPREATQTADGRTRVDVLLKEMEHLEYQSEPGAGFDFSGIRSELGLD